MSRLSTAIVLVALLLIPVPADAADGKKKAGVILTVAGSALMLGAFNWGTSCPPGYSTHTFQGLPTQCVKIYPNGDSDVREASTTAAYSRPAMMWSGVGAAGVGIVLLLLPKKVAQVVKVDVSVTPKGWLASRTFRF